MAYFGVNRCPNGGHAQMGGCWLSEVFIQQKPNQLLLLSNINLGSIVGVYKGLTFWLYNCKADLNLKLMK